MNTLRGQEALDLLGIHDGLLCELQRMRSKSASPEQMINYLHAQRITKAGAVAALRLAKVMPAGDTKTAVHFSQAYAYRRKDDEDFEEAAVQALEEIERSEAAA